MTACRSTDEQGLSCPFLCGSLRSHDQGLPRISRHSAEICPHAGRFSPRAPGRHPGCRSH
ncbi:hypothetical protein C8Q80DRAFT_169892 [Daedaleopsis nitida]|nr:hypothetical protein C8Q80DRAFT_169892 [Daedaleopsis nitida]